MGLLNQIVAARSRDDLDVLTLWDTGSSPMAAPELVGVAHVWHVVIHQKPSEKCFRRLYIPPILQEEIQDRTRIVNCQPQPAFLATDLDADLVWEPSGTPGRSSSVRSGENLMFRWRSVSWLI